MSQPSPFLNVEDKAKRKGHKRYVIFHASVRSKNICWLPRPLHLLIKLQTKIGIKLNTVSAETYDILDKNAY